MIKSHTKSQTHDLSYTWKYICKWHTNLLIAMVVIKLDCHGVLIMKNNDLPLSVSHHAMMTTASTQSRLKMCFNVFSKSSTKNICKERSFALQARLRWLSEVWRQKRRRGGKRRRGFVVNENENTSLYFSLFSWHRFRWSWFMKQANKVCDIESYKRYSFHSVNDSNFLLFPDCKGLP